jgi:hypothetical protein
VRGCHITDADVDTDPPANLRALSSRNAYMCRMWTAPGPVPWPPPRADARIAVTRQRIPNLQAFNERGSLWGISGRGSLVTGGSSTSVASHDRMLSDDTDWPDASDRRCQLLDRDARLLTNLLHESHSHVPMLGRDLSPFEPMTVL